MNSLAEGHHTTASRGFADLPHCIQAVLISLGLVLATTLVAAHDSAYAEDGEPEVPARSVTLNKKVNGYWGIWYSVGTAAAPYNYKYRISG